MLCAQTGRSEKCEHNKTTTKKTTNQHKMQLTQRKNQFNTTTKLNKEKGNRKKSKQNKTNNK